ncbi:MAG: hypothetical protein ACR2M9_00150 [Cyanophyceae cyanobacterium]
MAAIIEVKYFNTFLLKKVNKAQTTPSPGYGNIPVWNGSMGIPAAKGGYPRPNGNAVPNNWVIEESRINGGYNNTTVSFGAKAYLVEEEPNGTRRGNSLIYSGIFNSRTGINNTNVFSVADDIVKSVDPANGSIQKLYAEDTNLNIFQELKVSRALIDKDAIYSAEGGGTVTSTNLVIGAIQPYLGKFGISTDPTSFAIYGRNKYFSDRNNNVILRLSQSGLDEISSANMVDYFRDTLGGLTVAGVEGKILGGYDIYNKQYVVSTQEPNNNTIDSGYDTLAYDELVKGWTSFFSYKPDQMFSLGNQFYSLNSGKLYQHYSQSATRNVFYSDGVSGSALTATNPTAGTGYATPPSTGVATAATSGSGSGMKVTFTQAGGVVQANTIAIVDRGDNYQVGDTGTITTGNGAATYVIATINNSTPTSITFVFNPSVAASKNFKTVSYEGSNGWQVNSFVSDTVGRNLNFSNSNWVNSEDTTTQVYSYTQGAYVQDGVQYYAGFNRKENLYVANLINNSPATNGEVGNIQINAGGVSYNTMSGIKGFYATVTISTDAVTNLGGEKELFAVSTEYVANNGY